MALIRKLSGAKPATPLPSGATDTQMHLYLDGYPAQPGGPPIPEGTPGIEDYRKVADWLGIDRIVVTIGNAHQLDNGCLLECLRRLGGIARGVAAITGETSDSAMKKLADGGVSGARIMDLPGGAVGLDGLSGVDARANAFGWVVAVQFDGSHILDHMDKLAAIRSNWILDHHGKFLGGITLDDPRIDAVKQLIDKGNCWFKFAACYESSRTGPPDYDDVAAVARMIADYAPDRIIWGTNWPHNQATTTDAYPDDGALLDTVLGWIPKPYHQRVMVDNPAELFGFPR
jgi:D-galactarolactone isomerase